MSWTHILSPSYLQDARSTVNRFPTLREELETGEKLYGSVTYYDGQMDDSRLNVALATTAESHGARIANYVEVVDLIRDAPSPSGPGRVHGVVARDRLTGRTVRIRAKVVINASGPFSDTMRRMADAHAVESVVPAAGSHLALPGYFVPADTGLIIPKTKVRAAPGRALGRAADRAARVRVRRGRAEPQIADASPGISAEGRLRPRLRARSDARAASGGVGLAGEVSGEASAF